MNSVDVYASWEAFPKPQLVGTLQNDFLRGKEHFSFSYDPKWLGIDASRGIDPDLELYRGPQFADSGRNFRAFLDSSPDRWGRVLMRRREAILAKREDRKPKRLTEMDYLLGVHDSYRMGGLRFCRSDDPKQTFLSDDGELAAPPMTRLRELEQAVDHLEGSPEGEAERWLAMLLAPGSSLGGARPKANVIDEDGQLWIAKFSSRNDSRDVGAWEYVCNQLAKTAGLRVPDARLVKLGQQYRTFLSKRFDRTGPIRHHFSSAMTELKYYDDQQHDASYLQMAEFLQMQGAHAGRDLPELFRRIVFSIAISNCDDHLRNHGFLLGSRGWELSPAYDLNPAPESVALSLNISDTDNSLDFDVAVAVADFFRLSSDDAVTVVEEVREAVSHWEDVASSVELPKREIENMRPAFTAWARDSA